MGRPRAFDWDEAARLYAELGTYAAVARELGVAGMSVRRALNPSLRRRQSAEQRKRRAWVGACVDCGGPATIRQKSAGDKSRNGRCKACASIAAASSVRPDALRCTCCRLWLPDTAFPRRSAARSRRGRHAVCTLCGNVMRGDNRAANREREWEYEREYRAKHRAARRSA